MVALAINSPNDQPVSVAELRKQITLALEQRLTGLAKIVFVSGEAVTMVISEGGVRQVYYHQTGSVARVLSNFWLASQFSAQLACLSLQSLPARRLLFEKILLENQEPAHEARTGFNTSSLKQLFLSLKARESGSLVQIRWQEAEGLVLIPGSKLVSCPALFLEGARVEEDAGALGSIESWKETSCDLSIYHGGLGSEAWLEAHLVVLFESLCNYLLTQYGYLTGRVMITSIIQNLMILASQKGWKVDQCGSAVVDQTIFASPKEAAAAYHELLGMVLAHMGAVIGSALVQSLVRQSLGSYNTFYLNLIKTYDLI